MNWYAEYKKAHPELFCWCGRQKDDHIHVDLVIVEVGLPLEDVFYGEPPE